MGNTTSPINRARDKLYTHLTFTMMDCDCDFALMSMQSSDPSGIYDIVKNHLKPFDSIHDLRSLYQQHFRFISQSIGYIYDQLNSFPKPKPSELFQSYELLLNCLKIISPVMVHSHVITMYE